MTPATSSPADASSLPRPAAASEPTDAELERGILDALRVGLTKTAEVLTAQLDDRRRARLPANVESFQEAKTRRRHEVASTGRPR